MRIAFIGTGVMGKSMAGHLMDAGHELHIYNRSRSKAHELVRRGAVWHDTPAECVEDVKVVFTIVGYPKDVEDVYFGGEGILQACSQGTILVDMTTSDPVLAVRIAGAAAEKGCASLDAPVSGGDVGAQNAALSIMVGGDTQTFDKVLPLFECMGKNIVYQGPAGSGQHTKMSNQIAVAAGMLGVSEALAYARKAGLDPETVLKSIESGAAGSWVLSNLAPRMIQGNFDPGFYVKHFIKDMKIALDSAEKINLDAPGLRLVLERYKEIEAGGGGDLGTQALYKLYEK